MKDSEDPAHHELLPHLEGDKVKRDRKKIAKETWAFISDVLLNAVIILFIVGLTRTLIASPFQVSGSSMEPSLHDRSYIVVDKISYRFREPARGDIIVLVPPENTETFFVKRIIGLPGEKIEFLNGEVIIHNNEYPAGFKLDEPYLTGDNTNTYLPHKENSTIEIGEDRYFVMGDNRGASNDSRLWGTLHYRNIEGLAFFIVWPWADFKFLSKPNYVFE